jgi:predicted permease
MHPLRWLAAKLVRGPHADQIRQDLDELYVRDRARGVSGWRAHARYLRLLAASALSVWQDDRRWAHARDVEWRRTSRGGSMLQDLRFALRLFRRHPAPIAIAIGGLALAIGVVTSAFSIVNATMLRPYGMDDPASVVLVTDATHGPRAWPYWSYARFVRMRDEATLARVEASEWEAVRFGTTPASETDASRRLMFVSGGYLSMLGGRPLHGRSLQPADDEPGAAPVVVASHHFWATQLNADVSMVGKPVWLNGASATLVGVLRPEFTGPIEFDSRPALWTTFAARDEILASPPIQEMPGSTVQVVARLAPGASMEAAEQNLDAIVARTRAARPASHAAGAATSQVRLFSAASPIDGPPEADVYIVLASIGIVAGLVLALACANTANLLMAAAVTRRREMGVRQSLGASTARLVRQVLNESLLLGGCAGALGFLLAHWSAPLVGAIVAMPPELDLSPDARVLAFTIGVALICGLGAGLSPARYGARGHVLAALQSQGGSPGWGTAPTRLRSSFVGFQAAVSMLLLVFAALFARTAWLVTRADPGFDADRLLVVRLEPTRKGLDHSTYLQTAVAALRGLPSVEGVSVAQHEPLGNITSADRFSHHGASFQLNTHQSDGAFFSTAGVRLLSGRTFTDDEVAAHAPVAIVSDRIARAFFRGSPIGQSLSNVPAEDGGRQDAATVVGVAADALLDRTEGQVAGTIYRPLRPLTEARGRTDQGFPIPPSLIVRAAPSGLSVRAVEDALRRADPSVRPTTTLVKDRLEAYRGNKRMLAWLAGPIAALALFLAALGVYGVTAFVVGQRTAEVSVRMALGATPGDVMRRLTTDGLRPVLIGLGIGLLGALAASRASASMLALSGISPHDPFAIGAAGATLLACAFAAVIVPARRAAKTDPAQVLRQA